MSVIATLVSLPVAIWTVALGVALLYWVFVIAGLVHLGDGADGAVEGAAKGAAEALGHGLDGAGEGVDIGEGAGAEGADGADGADGGDADAGEHAGGPQQGVLSGLLGALKLRKVPATVSMSLLVFFAWATSLLLATAANAFVPAHLLTIVHWACTLGIAPLLALPLAGLVTRPLAPLFAHKAAKSHHDMIGRTCVVRTGEVTGTFGEATVTEPGVELVLRVRVDGTSLKRGQEGLIVGWDETREEYIVEALDEMLRETHKRN
jgi:hypothetical protein